MQRFFTTQSIRTASALITALGLGMSSVSALAAPQVTRPMITPDGDLLPATAQAMPPVTHPDDLPYLVHRHHPYRMHPIAPPQAVPPMTHPIPMLGGRPATKPYYQSWHRHPRRNYLDSHLAWRMSEQSRQPVPYERRY